MNGSSRVVSSGSAIPCAVMTAPVWRRSSGHAGGFPTGCAWSSAPVIRWNSWTAGMEPTWRWWSMPAAGWGRAPGQIAWISDAAREPDGPLTAVGILGIHGLAVPEVLELGQALGRLPQRLDVLVVALDDSGFGIGFSPGVEAGVDRAAEMLVDQVRSFADGAAVASREA